MIIELSKSSQHLLARQRRRAGRSPQLQLGAMKAIVADEKKEAIKLSCNQYASLKELRRRRHPYARGGTKNTPSLFGQRLRAGFPQGPMPAPPFVINRQTGLFVRSWRTRVAKSLSAYTSLGGTITGTLYNVAPYSKYMQGTRYMIKRPILEEVRRRCHRRRTEALRKAIKRLNKGGV